MPAAQHNNVNDSEFEELGDAVSKVVDLSVDGILFAAWGSMAAIWQLGE